ncbi:MAG: oligosaccharide flippase family protein [Anaerolineae bacterium]|nr:oligosaccharide flippase family protein [Anaerolineae bacterium]
MSDKEKRGSMTMQFINGFLATGLGKVSVVVLGFLGLMIATRVIDTEQMGYFFLIQIMALFLTELSNFGMTLALPRFTADIEDADDKRLHINTAVYFRIVTIIGACILALVLRQPFSQLFGGEIPDNLLIFLPIMVALESTGKLIVSVLQSYFKFRPIGTISVISSVVNMASIVLFTLVLGQGVFGLLIAKVLSRAVAFGYGTIIAPFSLRPEFDAVILRKMLWFGFPLQVNYILSFIYQRIDTFLIGVLIGTEEVAFYEIARRIPDSLTEVFDAFIQVYFPYVSKLSAPEKRAEVSAVLNTSLRWITLIMAFGSAIALLFGTEIITTIFSTIYSASSLPFGLLMISAAVVMIDSILGYLLVAIGAPHLPPAINMVRTVVGFILYIILLPSMGMIGAAFVNILSILIVNPIYVFVLSQRKVVVQITAFAKPLLIVHAILLLMVVVGQPVLWVRVLMVLVFLPINIFIAQETLKEALAFLKERRLVTSSAST